MGYLMFHATFITLNIIFFQETLCVTVAKIKKLNATRHGWLYDGCNECTKSVRMDGGKLKCTSDHVNEKPLPRYEALYFDSIWPNESNYNPFP